MAGLTAGAEAAPAGPRAGLSSAEAARRLAETGPNEVGSVARVPLWSRVGAQLRDPLILVLLAALVLTVVVGDYPDAIVIGLVVTVNTAVGVTQEVRADHAVEALASMSAPAARVVRDGAATEVPAAGVVPGDVLLLGEGDVIPADASLLEASALLVDESSVTGESVAVDKDAAPGQDGTLRAGTVVVHGRAVAEVTATGAESTMGRMAALLAPRAEPTPLQRRLAGLGRVLALVTVGLCVIVAVLGLARGQGLELMAVTAISLAVAAVPESLPAVVTLSLALGARRMAALHAIVRRLPAVETLGSVTVLATDKTGTLTQGVMLVERVWTPAGTVAFTGHGYRPEGDLRPAGAAGTAWDRDAVLAVLNAAALCNDARLAPPQAPDGDWQALGDPTEAALLTAAAKAGLDHDRLVRDHPRVGEEPFDSVRRRMSTLHRAVPGTGTDSGPGAGTEVGTGAGARSDGDGGTGSGPVRVCLKGAPEAVLGPDVLGDPPPLLAAARDEAARLAADGYRVLAVADGTRPALPAVGESAETGLRLLGLVAMNDPPKQSAAATLAACRRAGITPVLITGDHPATAAAVARRLGLLPDGPRTTRDPAGRDPEGSGGGPGTLPAVTPATTPDGGTAPAPDGPAAPTDADADTGTGTDTGTDADAGTGTDVVTGQELAAGEIEDLTRVRVFARTSPPQKLDIVQAWRAAGGVTAMTGDGVNDGPALRRADIGVAMGHRGTEVARQAADLVLADDELATVVAAVREGRRIYDNIRRFLLYALSGGAAEIAVMLLGPAFGLALPLRAGQILWINLLTHGLTGVAMGAEPASPAAMDRPPRPPREHVLGAGLWYRVLAFGALVTAVSLGAALWSRGRGDPWQSVLFLTLLAAQLGVCLGLRESRHGRDNPFLPAAVLASGALGVAALYVPALRTLLDTDSLAPGALVPALLAAVLGAAAGRAALRAERRPVRSASDPEGGPPTDAAPSRAGDADRR